jgi:hypothetical protein
MRRLVLWLCVFFSFASLARYAGAQNFITTSIPPVYSLLQGDDGNFYGTSNAGFFQLTPSGYYTLLNASDNAAQSLICIEGGNGSFYGFVYAPSLQIVKISRGGQLTLLGELSSANSVTEPGCLVMANDGNFYSGSPSGGLYGHGFLFQVTPSGTVTVFYNFTGTADGDGPTGLVQGSDGDLYGLDGSGLFRYSPSTGVVVVTAQQGAMIGAPVEAADGNFYGVGGPNLYQMTAAGGVRVLEGPGTPNSYMTAESVYVGGDQKLYTEYVNSAYNPYVCGGLFQSYVQEPVVDVTGYPYGYAFQFGDVLDYGDNSVTASVTLGGNGDFYGIAGETLYEGACPSASYFGVIDQTLNPAPTPPIQIGLSKTHVLPGGTSTLTWQVNNAFSQTMQQCYGFGGLSGKLATSGSALVTAAGTGSYEYAVQCGGVESALATLSSASTQLIATGSALVAPGVPATLEATVANSGTPSPTGNVTFLYGSQTLGTAVFNASGLATFTASTSKVPPGTYRIVASYPGDANYGAAVSSPFAVTVVAGTKTELSLSATTAELLVGQPISFTTTATGTNSNEIPSGVVSLHYGSMVLGSAPLAPTGSTTSTAVISPSSAGVPSGTYAVTASYPGDGWNLPATSNVVTVTVVADSVSEEATPNPVPTGDGFTLTATVSGKSTPTGTVIFYAGTQALGSNSLNGSGVASVQLPAGILATGSYQVTAYYAGDAHNPADTSPAITLVVQ